MTSSIGIIGGGAWGSALAFNIVRAGFHPVIYSQRGKTQWQRDITASAPGLEHMISRVTVSDHCSALRECDVILYVGKAQMLRQILCDLLHKHALSPSAPFVICSKGIEAESGALLHDIASSLLPDNTPVCMLSGPNFASEIAQGLPAAAVLASSDKKAGAMSAEILKHEHFRVYVSQDVTGVALCGAFKNIIAIACGMADGRMLGHNARAALITRSLAELTRLIQQAGGDPSTVYGLSGIGDMMLTCTSDLSRNYRFGRALVDDKHQDSGRLTAEGTDTAKGIMHLAQYYHTELPICAAVARILYDNSTFEEEVKDLLGRPSGVEY